jgi:hypothetical protein
MRKNGGRTGLTVLLAVFLSAPVFSATVSLNLFEAGDIGNWTSSNPSVCPLSWVGTLPGPCIDFQTNSVIAYLSEGTKSGLVHLQGIDSDTDCNNQDCSTSRKLSLSSLPVTNWSVGYTRVELDVLNGGQTPVDVELAISDGAMAGGMASPLTLPVGGGWTTISLQIQELSEAGINVSAITKALIKFNPPAECATVFVDNLRLVVGAPPNPPTAVTVLPAGTSGNLTVSWTPPVPAPNHYEVYWSTVPFTSVKDATSTPGSLAVPGGNVSWTISGLSDGTQYYVKVVAVALNGDKSASAPAGLTNVRGVPICMLGTVPGVFSIPGKVRLMWTAVPGATNYRIYRGVGAGSLSCPINPANQIADLGNVTLWDDVAPSVSAGTTYCYQVIPYTGAWGTCVGECMGGACVLYTNSGCAPPGPLGALILSMTNTGVVIQWNRPIPGVPAISNYLVIRDSTVSMGPVYDTGVSSYSLTDTGLVVSGNYCYQTVAREADGESCSSYSSSGCIAALIPPQGPTIYPCADRIRITYSPPPNNLIGTEYVVYRMNATDTCANYKLIGTMVTYSSTPVYFDDFANAPPGNLVDGNTYYYRLVSKKGALLSDCSPELSAKYQAGIGTCPCMKPGIPSTLTVLPGADRAFVVWDRPPEGENPLSIYKVQSGLSPTGPWVQVGTEPDTGPTATYFTYTATGLLLGDTNCFRIISEDTLGCSSTSYAVCATTVCKPITPKEPIAVTAVNGTSLVIAWQKPAINVLGAPLSGYVVWHAPNSGGVYSPAGPIVFDDGASSEFTWTHTGQDLTKTHCYRVQLLDNASPNSCTVFTSEVCRNCNAPKAFNIMGITAMPGGSPGNYSNNMALAWTKPAIGDLPLSHYQVRRSAISASGPWTIAGTVYEPDMAFFVDTIPGTLPLVNQFFYEIAAVDESGCSNYCAAQAHSCAGVGAFAATAMTYTVTGTMMKLSWTAAAPGELPVSNYQIWRFNPDSSRTQVATTLAKRVYPAISPLVFWDSPPAGLQWNQGYCWEMAAVDESGCSVYSASTCYDCVPPTWNICDPAFGAPPAGNADFTTLDSTSILISWNRAGDGDTMVSKYFVFRSTDTSCSPGSVVATVYSDGCDYPSATCPGACNGRFSFTDTGLPSASIQYYRVMAVSKTGCTEMSSCSYGNTKGGCAFTSAPVITALPSSAVIKWAVQFSGTINGYEVWRSAAATGKTSQGKVLVAQLPATAVSFTDIGLQPESSYCYVIVLKVDPSCSTYSEEVCMDTVKFTAYPNPARLSKGPVYFDGLTSGMVVEVYTVTGELIKKHTVTSKGLWSWDGRNDSGTTIAGGVYLYLIRDGGTVTKRGKLVINR